MANEDWKGEGRLVGFFKRHRINYSNNKTVYRYEDPIDFESIIIHFNEVTENINR